jgi:hypothetical protein
MCHVIVRLSCQTLIVVFILMLPLLHVNHVNPKLKYINWFEKSHLAFTL